MQDRVIGIAEFAAAEAIEVVSFIQSGIEAHGAIEGGNGLARMAGDVEGEAARGMGFGQVRRQFERPAAVGDHLLIGDIEIAIDPKEGIAIGNSGIGTGIARVVLHCLVEEPARGAQIFARAPADGEPGPAAQVVFVGLRVRGGARGDRLALLGQQLQLERRDHVLRDLVLERKDIGEFAFEALRPEMIGAERVDQLHIDADLLAGFLHAALQDVPDIEIARDIGKVGSLALVGKGLVAGDDEQRRDLGEIGGEILGDAVGEILLLGIAADVVEGQDHQRTASNGGGPDRGRRFADGGRRRDRLARGNDRRLRTTGAVLSQKTGPGAGQLLHRTAARLKQIGRDLALFFGFAVPAGREQKPQQRDMCRGLFGIDAGETARMGQSLFRRAFMPLDQHLQDGDA